MDYSRQCCRMPVAYNTICNSPLCDSNKLCTKCLDAKWGQQSVMPIAKLHLKDGCLQSNGGMLQWRDISYFVDHRGNVDQKSGTDASVQTLDARSEILNVLLDAKYPIFGSNYFSFLCAALRHKNDDMLRLMLLCDDFRHYCGSKLIGPKECYKSLLVQQCNHWNSWTCMKHFVELGFFDEKQFTCNMLAHAAAINTNFIIWTNMWNIHFKQTFEVCWHKDIFATALIAGNLRVTEFLMKLDQFSVCFCDTSPVYQNMLRYYWSQNQRTKTPSCLICMTNTMTIEGKQDAPIAIQDIKQDMNSPTRIVPSWKTVKRRQRQPNARKGKHT